MAVPFLQRSCMYLLPCYPTSLITVPIVNISAKNTKEKMKPTPESIASFRLL